MRAYALEWLEYLCFFKWPYTFVAYGMLTKLSYQIILPPQVYFTRVRPLLSTTQRWQRKLPLMLVNSLSAFIFELLNVRVYI